MGNFIKTAFFSGHERSIKAKKNIIGLLFVKGYGVIISLLLIPLTLQILNDYKYGIWITIFNLLSMIQLFDIGIGNGLRNKIAETNVISDIKDVKEYVSTAYIIMGIISLVLILLFLLMWNFIDWSVIFNVNSDLKIELRFLILVCFILTILQFFFGIINSILTAYHLPVKAGLYLVASNTIIFLTFFFLKDYLKEDLFLIGFVYTITPVLVLFVISVMLFSFSLKKIKPSFSSFSKSKVKELLSLGGEFFILQIAVLIIFQTDALIISHALSPSEVTPYSIVYKYFSVITMFSNIILTPFWSAYTEAYSKRDYKWIKNTVNKQLKGFIMLILVVSFMLIFSKKIITLWIGQNMELAWILIFGTACFTIISIWNNIFATLLNGLSKTRIQIITAVLGLVINIPLSFFLARSYGSGGVIIATCISLSFFAIFGTFEAFSVIKRQLNE